MKKIYKRSLLSLIYNLIGAVAGAIFVAVIVGALTDKIVIAGGVGCLILILAVGFMFSQSKLQVEVDDQTVTFITKKKDRSYTIADCTFHSKITNNDDFDLTVYCNGERESFDCSFLSGSDYSSLLEDLGVVGEKQEAIKLTTNRKL